MDLGQLAQQLGLPVALAIYFIIENRRIQKDHLDDVKNIASQAVEAINKNTESDKAVTEQIVKNNTALTRSESIMNRLEGVISTGKEQQNGNRGA